MSDKNKFSDEKLTDDELNVVVGGTVAETQEFMRVIYRRLYPEKNINALNLSKSEVNVQLKNELEKELASFRITAKVDVGINGTGIGEKANEYYTPKGHRVTQEQLMNIFNK